MLDKAGRMYEFAVRGRKASRELIQTRRERGAEITGLMGFPEETAQAMRSLDEHWDGKGHPDGLRGRRSRSWEGSAAWPRRSRSSFTPTAR